MNYSILIRAETRAIIHAFYGYSNRQPMAVKLCRLNVTFFCPLHLAIVIAGLSQKPSR